jgi:poly-gamma-glutamate system protein
LREELLRDLRASTVPLVEDADLRANVERRMGIYPEGTAAFVNIGGSHANLGVSPLVLEVIPGLVEEVGELALPGPHQRGVLFEMAARGTPVIHLLHIRGLALRYGLPWDPVPLPEAGLTRLREEGTGKGWIFWLLTAAYGAALGLIVGWGRLRPVRRTRQ